MHSLSPHSIYFLNLLEGTKPKAAALCAAALLFAGCGGTPGGLGSGEGSSSGGSEKQFVIDGIVTDSPNPARTAPGFPSDNAQSADGADDNGTQVNVMLSVDPGASASSTTREEATASVPLNNANQVAISLGLTNVNSFQVVSQITGRRLQTLTLADPAGNEVLSAENNDPPKTLGLGIDNEVNALGYPTSGDDPAVTEGAYVQTVVTDSGDSDSLQVTIKAKNDPNLSGGALRVNLFYVGEAANQQSNQSGVRSAVQQWRTIYGAAGITLSVKEIELRNETGNIPIPFSGSSFYERYSADSRAVDNALNVFVGEEIVGGGDLTNVLGIAGGIPGPFVPTNRSGVAISLSEVQGADGSLSGDDITVLASTLAHEGGHFLGLFHPVEVAQSGSGYSGGDALNDTPRCATTQECIAVGAVNNLMFPVSFGATVPQQNLSGDQRRVLNLQVIVD